MLDETTPERFWPKVVKTDNCWLWVGARSGTGYGNFYVKNGPKSGRYISAHRVMWEMQNGPLLRWSRETPIEVLHRCDNRGCVRPEHIFLGSHKENQVGMVARGRNCPRGVRPKDFQEPVEQTNRKELLELRQKSHYRRTRPRKYNDPQERLTSRIQPTDASSCWNWNGARNRGGYGLVNINAMSRLAHRISWETFRSPIPNGLQVCHSCDNPPCINPAHLFLGTGLDNVRDAVSKNRITPSRARGEESGAAKLTEGDVRAIRESTESCMKTGKKYGVNDTTISKVRRRQTWRHVQ